MGVVSTTLPSKDGINILQHSSRLRNFLQLTAGLPVVPIGRLDKASRGLLLLTTDTTLADILLRPSIGDIGSGSAIEKVYHVTTARRVPEQVLHKLRKGVNIRVRNWSRGAIQLTTLPCSIERLKHRNGLVFQLREGKNRQIRKMLGEFDHRVVDLFRVQFGSVKLCGLREGEAELLSPLEVQELLSLANLRESRNNSATQMATSSSNVVSPNSEVCEHQQHGAQIAV
jgi:pseudouridine synthase